jgi:hypothetical protein
MGDEALKRELETLERLLMQHGELGPVQMIRAALDGSYQQLQAFLTSNELWGGAGSIADQAGVNQGRDVRRPIEVVLARLGREQIRQGVVNVRTDMWVDAFSKWQREGI